MHHDSLFDDSESILSLVFNRRCSRNSRILLAFNSTQTHTHHKIIFHTVQKGWSKLQGQSQAALHRIRAVRIVHFAWCYIYKVRPFHFQCFTFQVLQGICWPTAAFKCSHSVCVSVKEVKRTYISQCFYDKKLMQTRSIMSYGIKQDNHLICQIRYAH